MKDAKGHGSDPRGSAARPTHPGSPFRPLPAHQDATVSSIPTKAGVDAMVERLRAGARPDLSGATPMPGWLRWFGAAARRERRESRN